MKCSQCDSEMEEGDEVYNVKMQDKNAPHPDLDFYTITVCSRKCVDQISKTGEVRRISSEKTIL